jgi:hypothetical protein
MPGLAGENETLLIVLLTYGVQFALMEKGVFNGTEIRGRRCDG